MLWLASTDSWANPEGMTVVSGAAQATQQGTQLRVTASDGAFLNWASFNIGAGESTWFQQPSASSIVWNRIGDANPSQIYGSLQANGLVVLSNPSGFYFGPNAFVRAAGLIVTTCPIAPQQVGAGMDWSFSGPPPSIPIVNHGRIETDAGGSLFLIARQIENHGRLEAPGGTVGLVAGEEVTVSTRPNGLGLSARARLPQGAVNNQGQVVADAGRILLQGETVNQGGLVRANSLRERNGVIELVASDTVELGTGSLIQAVGGEEGISAGGEISVSSAKALRDTEGSRIDASGGRQGGHGGNIALSAPEIKTIKSSLEAPGGAASAGGSLAIASKNIALVGTAGAQTLVDTLQIGKDSAFSGFASMRLEAEGGITLKKDVAWNPAEVTQSDETGNTLTLRAGKDLKLETGAKLLAGDHWSLSLVAGAEPSATAAPESSQSAPGSQTVAGVGSVNLAGTAVIETGEGDIEIAAGKNVTVATGAIRTAGGGSIRIEAEAGNVDCGTNPNGFEFSRFILGYEVSRDLGGVSTMRGGDVFIQAGGNIQAFLPPQSGNGSTTDAGTGAFGAEPGNVTLKAGGNVSGHYVLRNGNGVIGANGDAGTASRPLALSLVKGGWNVEKATRILLQEVRNPNGMFNASRYYGTGSPPEANPMLFLFDYDPKASVRLVADAGIVLAGGSLPRASSGNQGLIFPPQLFLSAGNEGVKLGANVVLFPSPQGALEIRTTSGGNLGSSSPGTGRTIMMSDSDARQWANASSFSTHDFGQTLLHADNPTPVLVQVDGSVSDLTLILPKRLEMTVAKDISNTSIIAQNLKVSDHTLIQAGGQIGYRSYYTFLKLADGEAEPQLNLFEWAIDMSQLDQLPVWSPDPVLRVVAKKITYNPVTRRLGYAGRMTNEERDALLSMRVLRPDGSIEAAMFASPEVIAQLHAQSQDVPTAPGGGIEIRGPGTLDIRAASMDLGVSLGLASLGISPSGYQSEPNRALIAAMQGLKGAAINLELAGDLDLFSTTILSQYGGDITIRNCGNLNVGSQDRLTGSDLPRGIVTLWNGNITIETCGNVEVNGSRIASYDGGSVRITSLHGYVDAGAGGNGFVRVYKPYIDPETGEYRTVGVTIPGSGVLTASYPVVIPGQTEAPLGNISIETPEGDIRAGVGGIVQLALADNTSRDAEIYLHAGSTTPDGTVHRGNIVAVGSGIIGNRVRLEANGDISGLVIAQGAIDIQAQQNVNVTAIGQSTVNVSAAGSVSGTIVGVSSVNVAGQSIGATMISAAVNASGAVSATPGGTQAAAPAASTAGQAATQSAQEAVADATASQENSGTEEEEEKRKKGRAVLAEYVGRVTVILPGQ